MSENRGKLTLFRRESGPIVIPNFPSDMFPQIARMPGGNDGKVMIEFNDGQGRMHTHWVDQVTGMSFEAY